MVSEWWGRSSRQYFVANTIELGTRALTSSPSASRPALSPSLSLSPTIMASAASCNASPIRAVLGPPRR